MDLHRFGATLTRDAVDRPQDRRALASTPPISVNLCRCGADLAVTVSVTSGVLTRAPPSG